MIKRLIHQEDIKIRSVFVSKKHNFQINEGTWKLVELSKEIDQSTILVGDFNTLLSVIDRKSREVISKTIKDFSNSINQLDLIDIYG